MCPNIFFFTWHLLNGPYPSRCLNVRHDSLFYIVVRIYKSEHRLFEENNNEIQLVFIRDLKIYDGQNSFCHVFKI